MKSIGLTGGIGMGKSTVAQMLAARGACVVDTDELARKLVEMGQPALAEIQNTFGVDVIGADGRLAREALAKIVFSDAAKRQQLEAILHPRIRKAWLEQLDAWRREGKPLAVVVIPLLFETKAETEFDTVICVACSRETQHARLLARGWSSSEIELRIAAQMPIAEKMQRANHVVWTEGDLDGVGQQLDRILRKD